MGEEWARLNFWIRQISYKAKEIYIIIDIDIVITTSRCRQMIMFPGTRRRYYYGKGWHLVYSSDQNNPTTQVHVRHNKSRHHKNLNLSIIIIYKQLIKNAMLQFARLWKIIVIFSFSCNHILYFLYFACCIQDMITTEQHKIQL